MRTEPLVAGTIVHFESEIMGETRPILVQFPDVEAGTAVDVVVVLDAETHGFHISGLVDFFSHEHVNKMPKAMVVGVVNTNRLRDTTPTPTERWSEGGGVHIFNRFLSEELIPWIDKNYSTTGQRTLIGHSGSGIAAMYSVIDGTGTFGHVVAVDPSLDWDDDHPLEDLKSALKSNDQIDCQFLVSTYTNKKPINSLKKLLRKSAPKGLDWSIEQYESESHNSMVHKAVYDALLAIHG